MKLKLYQVYNGTVIGVRSKRWDSQSNQKIYASSLTKAVKMAYDKGWIPTDKNLQSPYVLINPYPQKPSFFSKLSQRLRFWR